MPGFEYTPFGFEIHLLDYLGMRAKSRLGHFQRKGLVIGKLGQMY